MTFTFQPAPGRYQDRVAQLAVLFPIMRQRYVPRTAHFHVPALVEMWRARLSVLRGQNFHEIDLPRRFHFARNCRPTFAVPSPETQVCKLRPCPFCWGRAATELWHKVDTVCQLYPKYDLIERYYTYLWAFDNGDEHPQAMLRRLLQDAVASRKRAIAGVTGLVGAYLRTNVEPMKSTWRVTNRQLFLVKRDGGLSPDLMARGKSVRSQSPLREIVCHAVARVCRYPRGLLVGAAGRTAFLLNTMHSLGRLRLSATYGAFRKVES